MSKKGSKKLILEKLNKKILKPTRLTKQSLSFV